MSYYDTQVLGTLFDITRELRRIRKLMEDAECERKTDKVRYAREQIAEESRRW